MPRPGVRTIHMIRAVRGHGYVELPTAPAAGRRARRDAGAGAPVAGTPARGILFDQQAAASPQTAALPGVSPCVHHFAVYSAPP